MKDGPSKENNGIDFEDLGADVLSELFGSPDAEAEPSPCLWLANCVVNGLTRLKQVFVSPSEDPSTNIASKIKPH